MRKRNISVAYSRAPPTGDLAHNPGMCPDWESNPRPFGSQARAQSPELHQPGLFLGESYAVAPWILLKEGQAGVLREMGAAADPL